MQIRRAILAALAALLTGCGDAEPPAETESVTLPPEAAAHAEPRTILSSDRIYYDLTRYDWYARGEPLIHDQLAFQPVGTPVSASLEDMERQGEYDGVEYYRRSGDELSLYVPVFDGYWLAFRPAETAARAD